MACLENQTALVTGAAQGIGRGIARSLAAAGANIIIGDLNTAKAEVVAAEISALGRASMAVDLDVTNEGSIEQALATAYHHFSSIDILVNNAGVMQEDLGEQTSARDFDACHSVNLKSVWLITRAIAEHFKVRQSGKIINITSAAGRQGMAEFPAYCASKAAAINLTQSLSRSLAPFNINVNAICPGLIWTPMWEQIEAMVGDADTIEARKAFADSVKQTPLGRPVTPEDIGSAVVFLASKGAKNITGQSLNIDGGLVLN